MGNLDNRTLLQKADLAISDLTAGTGILVAAQAHEFLRLLIKQSTLLPLATVVPMKAPKQQISKIKFGSRIMRPGTEAVAVADASRVKPDLTGVELNAVLIKGEVHLDDETMEDNVEQGKFQSTVMQLMSEACARDVEELAIMGDTTSSDTYLALLNGILKQSTSHIVDVGSGGAGLTSAVLRDMLKTLPPEQLRDKANMRFFTSVDGELYYRNVLADRLTLGGDAALHRDDIITYSGVPMTPIPLFPETLGGTLDRTVAILCNPKNIHVGIWRDIRLETFRDVSAGLNKIVATMRVDVKYAVEDAVVKAINLKV